jgi:UDP-3-O-[3-hydroxymyristoyl] glucosamine N-acyltransferase
MAQRIVTPAELLASGSVPRRLGLHPQRASFYASQAGLTQAREDFEIAEFRPLSALNTEQHGVITYLSSRRFSEALQGRAGVTVVTREELQPEVPRACGLLLTTEDPRSVFYALLECAQRRELFERLAGYRSQSARIAPNAVISDNVHISANAQIDAGAALLPNTFVGEGVVVKANAVIGGNGFETSSAPRRIVGHAGGVWLSEGSQVGSCTCIDKGLFGEFTVVGRRTLIDNLVHFAHAASAGEDCSIIACAEISGSVTIENGVWVGPNASINQQVRVGAHAYIGTGSVVTRDLPAHALAYGAPARAMSWVCECRAKLAFANNAAQCEACGKRFTLIDGKVQRR